jgi:hypothetical protein
VHVRRKKCAATWESGRAFSDDGRLEPPGEQVGKARRARVLAHFGPVLDVLFRDDPDPVARPLKVSASRFDARTFERCAGFLRIRDGDEPLDVGRDRDRTSSQ